jgi:hypothetical protein
METSQIQRFLLSLFRRRRMKWFFRYFKVMESIGILDVGGTLFFWDLIQCPV